LPDTDRDLLAGLSGADEGEARAAFDAIFRTWYAPLVRAADAVVRERAVAEELVQDVMLELWRRRERLDGAGSPQAYLFQATRNRALNHLRHLRVEQRGAAEAAREESRDAPAPSQLVAAEMEAAVRLAIGELTPRCREVYELSRVHGLRYAEIADTLGVSVKAVEAQMGKALKALRERLAPWLPDGDRL
jgi:RNA polymerase sigma-70 factor (ECF subfamily)